MSENSILVFFPKENKYSIIDDSNKKFKNQKKIKVKSDAGKWVTGEIKFTGNEEMCIKYARHKYSDTDYQPTEDEETQLCHQDE